MRYRSILAMLLIAMLAVMPAALSEAETDQGLDVDVSVNDVPVDDLVNAFANLFVGVMQESTEQSMSAFNEILGDMASGLNEGLGELEDTMGQMLEEQWKLSIPEWNVEEGVRRSVYDDALTLYKAQLAEEADSGAKMAKSSVEGSGNTIIYINDADKDINPGLFTKLLGFEDPIVNTEILFGAEGAQQAYEVIALLKLKGSDEPMAMCNMADISAEPMYAMYTDYVVGHAIKSYEDRLESGEELLTLIFWNQDEGSEWLTVVAGKR